MLAAAAPSGATASSDAQREQHDRREQHARQHAVRDRRDRDGRHRDGTRARRTPRPIRRPGPPPRASRREHGAEPRPGRGGAPLPVLLAACERDLGRAARELDHVGGQRGSCRRLAAAAAPRHTADEPRPGDARERELRGDDQPGGRQHERRGGDGQRAGCDRDQRRAERAQVEVLEPVGVADEAREQIGAARLRRARPAPAARAGGRSGRAGRSACGRRGRARRAARRSAAAPRVMPKKRTPTIAIVEQRGSPAAGRRG